MALDLLYLLSQHVWGVAEATDNSQTSSIGDSGSELRTSRNVHASKEDGVSDLQEIRERSPDLFCSVA